MAQTPDSLADEQRGVMGIEWRQTYRGRVKRGYRQQSEASSRLQRNKLEKGLLCRQRFGALSLPICLYHTRVQE